MITGENARIQGEWLGEGAAKLGLTDVVAADDFLALCENQHPKSCKRLTQRCDAVRRVFYDFTFSPPKSVSVAALVADDERIVVAHARAVKIALGELEQFASARLRSRSRNSDRKTGNIVAALFQHETSRALDPHLHTHCIVFNATYDKTESRWKALQNYEMLAAQPDRPASGRRSPRRPGPCPRWRPTGAGTGWVRAAARMTGRWPGSAGWCPPWPCCLTVSCLTRSRLARMTCGYGSPHSRRKESSDWPRGCYHLAVRRGEC